MSAEVRPACGCALGVLSYLTTRTGFPAPPGRPDSGEALLAAVGDAVALGVSLTDGEAEALVALPDADAWGVRRRRPSTR